METSNVAPKKCPKPITLNVGCTINTTLLYQNTVHTETLDAEMYVEPTFNFLTTEIL